MARSLGTLPIQPQTPVTGGRPLTQSTAPQPTFLQGVWDSLANVPGRLAASAVNVGTAVTQGKQAADLQAQQGVDIPFIGNKKPIGQTGKGFVADLKDAVGTGLQGAAETAAFAAAPTSLPAMVATGAGIGAAQQAGGALQENKSLGDTAVQGLVGAATGAATGGLAYGTGKIVQKLGEGAYKFIIPRSMQEAKLLQTYKANVPLTDRLKAALTGAESSAPTTAADTSFNQGLIGTEGMLGVQAKKASNSIWNDVIAPKLDASPDAIHIPTFFKHIEDTIKKDTPELSRQKALLEGLQALKEDYAGVENVSLKQLQQFKQGWAQFIPDKAYQGKPIAGAFKDIQDRAADLARSTIYKSLGPDVRQAYFDYGNLQSIQELGQKAMAGGRFKGGFGGFWSAVKDEVLTPVMTIGGQIIYKTGQGVEFTGQKGATVLSDLFSPTTLKLLQSSQDTTGQSPQSVPTQPSPVSSPHPTTSVQQKDTAVRRGVQIAQKFDPTGAVGAVEKVGAKAVLANIHPDDLYVMEQFISHAKTQGYHISDGMFTEAEKLAQKFGISMDKGLKGVATEFENVLNGTKKVADTVLKRNRDTIGRFK